jgi:ribosomal protein L22
MSITSLKMEARDQRALCNLILSKTTSDDKEYLTACRYYNKIIKKLQKALHPVHDNKQVTVIHLSPEQLKEKLAQIQAEKLRKYGSVEWIPSPGLCQEVSLYRK